MNWGIKDKRGHLKINIRKSSEKAEAIISNNKQSSILPKNITRETELHVET